MTSYPFPQHDPGDEDVKQRRLDVYATFQRLYMPSECLPKPRALGFSEKHICRFYVIPGSMGKRRLHCECGKEPDRPLCGLDFRDADYFNGKG